MRVLWVTTPKERTFAGVTVRIAPVWVDENGHDAPTVFDQTTCVDTTTVAETSAISNFMERNFRNLSEV